MQGLYIVSYLRYGTNDSIEIEVTAESRPDAEKQVKDMFPDDVFPPLTMSMGPLEH